MIDPSVLRNLDAQARRLEELQAIADVAVEDDEPLVSPQLGLASTSVGYEELTRENDRLRLERGWEDVDLDARLTPELLERLQRWSDGQREPWTTADYLAVGLAGVVGGLAVLFDGQVDAAVRAGLGSLKETDVLQRWERQARGMPIDYTGPKFGGPAHRVRSAGHDMGRPFEALSQIRDGEFRGFFWEYGQKLAVSTSADGRFKPVESLALALTLWLKHLAADLVTPMSLPLPGWTALYELPFRDLRKFAHDAYEGSPLGTGLNVRSGLMTPMLSLLSTEAIIRTHIHWTAYSVTGTPRLTVTGKRKRDELLLAGHALVGAFSLGKAGLAASLGEGPVALRHVNVPVLTRAGWTALSVVKEKKRVERLAPPDWDTLVRQTRAPWELPEARAIEDLLN